MCTFLTVAIDKGRAPELEAALRAEHLEVSPQTNPWVAALFERPKALLLVTRGGCSCELLLPGPERDPVEKLGRRGLTRGQLARALEGVVHRPAQPRESFEALSRVLKARQPVQVFFHRVKGNPFTEAVPAGSTLSAWP
jgi:hypothetical protein